MFLSKILLNSIEKKKNKIINKNNLKIINKLNTLIFKIKYFKNLKKKNIKYLPNFRKFNTTINNNLINKLHFTDENIINKNINIFISYIITINFSSTNTRVYISNTKGNIIKNYSAGLANLSGKQKTKRYVALIHILKKILLETKSLNKSPVIVHFKNVTKNYPIKKIIKLIKNKFFIVSIKSFNKKPHNGCRPKKTKRLK